MRMLSDDVCADCDHDDHYDKAGHTNKADYDECHYLDRDIDIILCSFSAVNVL